MPTYISSALLLLGLVGLTACGSLDPEPFAEFHSTTKSLSTETAELFDLGSEWARKGYVTNVSVFDTSEELTDLTLDQDPDDSLVVELRDATPYMSVVRAARTSRRLNRAVVTYADLLARLAGDEVVPHQRIDALAADWNENVSDAAAAADVDVPDGALLSAVAAEAFRTYLESRRRAELVAALQVAQPTVDAWAELGADATERLGNDLYVEYLTERRRLLDAYARTSVDSKRKTAANGVLRVTETMLDAFASLRALRRAYQALPAAHAELVESARGERGFAGLRNLAAAVRRVRDLRDDLEDDTK